jgi:hypothetical protein
MGTLSPENEREREREREKPPESCFATSTSQEVESYQTLNQLVP